MQLQGLEATVGDAQVYVVPVSACLAHTSTGEEHHRIILQSRPTTAVLCTAELDERAQRTPLRRRGCAVACHGADGLVRS